MAPHPIPLPCALAFPAPSHRVATTPSPCWATHFMTQKRIMFSNPTPSKLRLSPAATMSDATPSALTLPLHCACIMQPTTPPQIVVNETSGRRNIDFCYFIFDYLCTTMFWIKAQSLLYHHSIGNNGARSARSKKFLFGALGKIGRSARLGGIQIYCM